MNFTSLAFLGLGLLVATQTTAFIPLSRLFPSAGSSATSDGRGHNSQPTTFSRLRPLQSGRGIATNYTWYEEAFEIEVTVKVPKSTKAKDIIFKATSNSLDLRLKQSNDAEALQLLDPTRRLRGKILTDGTYWEILDPEDIEDDDEEHRLVIITFEKLIKKAKDDFDVVDYDWNGVYHEEFEDEVSHRKYDEPEKLDVREYASSMGVDVDNINMSMVDKNMFSSGLNMTKKSMDALTDAGYLKEVTQQSDGSEWTADEDGDAVPFSSTGKVDPNAPKSPGQTKVPFLDTDSPWHKAVPVDRKDGFMEAERSEAETEPASVDAKKDDEKAKEIERKRQELEKQRMKSASDPIDTLTVAKLKEILRASNLKVSGNKKELQQRLREHVQSMLQKTGGD